MSIRPGARGPIQLYLLALVLVLVGLVPKEMLGDAASYFYDDLGRLRRVTKGTSGVVYKYDDLGNLIEVTSSSTSQSAPVIGSINPDVLFVGSRVFVNISGVNFLTTESVTSSDQSLEIEGLEATDTSVSTFMTAGSTGQATITVTNLYGSANVNVDKSSSVISMEPNQTALVSQASGDVSVTITPPLSKSVRLYIVNGNPSVLSAPAYVVVPTGGTASFQISALQPGFSVLSIGNATATVFVMDTFATYSSFKNGKVAAKNVSVVIDSPLGYSKVPARAVSAIIDSPLGTSPVTARGVSTRICDPASADAITPSISPYAYVGDVVTWTATASGGCGSYEYKFWLRHPNGSWTVEQDYSPVSFWNWTTTEIGSFKASFDVRNAGSQASYDDQLVSDWYNIYNQGIGPADLVSLTPSPPSPVSTGTQVTWTGVATGGTGSYEYRFWIKDPATGLWSIVQEYSADNTWEWTPTVAGNYAVSCQVHNAGYSTNDDVIVYWNYIVQ